MQMMLCRDRTQAGHWQPEPERPPTSSRRLRWVQPTTDRETRITRMHLIAAVLARSGRRPDPDRVTGCAPEVQCVPAVPCGPGTRISHPTPNVSGQLDFHSRTHPQHRCEGVPVLANRRRLRQQGRHSTRQLGDGHSFVIFFFLLVPSRNGLTRIFGSVKSKNGPTQPNVGRAISDWIWFLTFL